MTDKKTLTELYEQMVLIRVFETEAERQYKAAKIGGYCHLSSGQEATTVGVVHAMQEADLLVTGYRSHGFALARGLAPESVMAELFGREEGCAHGRGGSMHLLDVDRNYFGGWGIVAGQLPIATGLALALVRQGKKQAVVCELGDGAINMGAWHESLNLAAVWNLPVLFVVVNNQYGMGTAVERASAVPELHKRACAFGIEGKRIDGDDLDEVVKMTTKMLNAVRRSGRPAVMEAMTYRYRGHSVADAGLAYRTKDEIAEHQAKDPIKAVRAQLLDAGVSEDQLQSIDADADAIVAKAVEFADAGSEPSVSRLASGMYAQGSDEQFERMIPGSPFGERELVFAGGLGA